MTMHTRDNCSTTLAVCKSCARWRGTEVGKNWLSTFALLVLSGLAVGCDGGIHVYGRVYEWTDSPPQSNSEIYIKKRVTENYPQRTGDINEEPPKGRKVRLLQGVAVKVYAKQNYDETRIHNEEDIDEFGSTVVSEQDGAFEEHAALAPRRVAAAIRAKKSGYHTVVKTFSHPGAGAYDVTVFLVRKKDDADKKAEAK